MKSPHLQPVVAWEVEARPSAEKEHDEDPEIYEDAVVTIMIAPLIIKVASLPNSARFFTKTAETP